MKQMLYVLALMLVYVLSSCNSNVIFDKNNPLEHESWSYEQPQTFKVAIEDTAVRYNIYVSIRHSFHFEWRNLWVNIATQFPDGEKLSKRVNLLLSEADGRWFGDCSSDNCFIQIPLQENVIFPAEGTYEFVITQDMRVNPLANIRNVGLKVEKVISTAEKN
ncbi:MAG: gliding motility lipoprotein GldH [Chitinophagales bacterium]|nr:gliding motility lipoprotein GldH [Chitinophagales bacterium]